MDSKQSSSCFTEESASGQRPMGIMSEEEKVKKRKKNQEYAQRKRGKDRIEVEVLQGQCLELNRENSLLYQQQHSLQQLVQAANDMVQGYTSNDQRVVSTSRSSSSSLSLGAGSSSGMFRLLSQLPPPSPNTSFSGLKSVCDESMPNHQSG
jgi:Basic region leucine zipper